MTAPLPAASSRGKALVRDLTALFGAGAVSCDPADLWAMSRDCWPRSLLWTKAGVAPHPPDAVVWPVSAEEVQKLVRYAVGNHVALVPFGAGSGVCGGAVPVRGGIAVDLKRLSGPPRIDLPARVVETKAGMNGQRLEELLSAAGATLGHFPSSLYCSTVGGWLAARSAGQCSSRYGKIEDMVLSLEAVDGTGALLRTVDGPSEGPDLAQLLLGSEGTLAIFTAARLRCWPAPRARWMRGIRFASVQQGLRALCAVMRSGLRPAVARLYDPLDTALAGRDGGAALPEPLRSIAGEAGAEAIRFALRAPLVLNRLADALAAGSLLILGFEADGASAEADAAEEGEIALRLCAAAGGEDLGPSPGERWLANRYRISYRQSPLFSAGAFVDTMEVATTWDRLDSLYSSVRRAVSRLAFVLAHFSHAYLEGCSIYFTFVGLAGLPASEAAALRERAPARVEEDLAQAESRYDACWNAALGAAADEGATLSHHHGIGLAKQRFLSREHGEGLRQLRALKSAFDPHGILNPGKLDVRTPLGLVGPGGGERAQAQKGRAPDGPPDETKRTLREDLMATGAAVTSVPASGPGSEEGYRVAPPSIAALGRAVAALHARGVPRLVRGNGDAPVAPPPGGAVLDLSRLDHILAVDASTGIARVEAGCGVAALEEAARRAGSTLGPLLPSVRAGSVGAWLAGPTRGERGIPPSRRETAALSVATVLPDGRLAESRAAPRSATGPDLDHLTLGGGGRLCIVAAAWVRLFPLAPSATLAVCCADLAAAIEAIRRLCLDRFTPARAWLVGEPGGVALRLSFEGAEAARILRDRAERALLALGLAPAPDLDAAWVSSAARAQAVELDAHWESLRSLGAQARSEVEMELCGLHATGAFAALEPDEGESLDACASRARAAGAAVIAPRRLRDLGAGWEAMGAGHAFARLLEALGAKEAEHP